MTCLLAFRPKVRTIALTLPSRYREGAIGGCEKSHRDVHELVMQ